MITGWSEYLNYKFPVPTADDRRRVEQHIGYKLPDRYWEIAKEHQGEIPIPDSIVLKTGVMESCGVFLHVFDPDRLTDPAAAVAASYALVSSLRGMKRYYPRGIVPFSDDTGGNKMAFDFRTPGESSIVFVNHNVGGEDALTFVAPNFTAFLERLVPDTKE
jgi:hypothetical protein